VLDRQQDDRVGMVGYFPPLMPVLKQMVKEVLVFEKILEHQPGVYQEDKAPELLPSCAVAIITATALINTTLQLLLEACGNCREIAIVGATTPLAPDIFKPLGVTLLSGILVTDPRGILRQASETTAWAPLKGLSERWISWLAGSYKINHECLFLSSIRNDRHANRCP